MFRLAIHINGTVAEDAFDVARFLEIAAQQIRADGQLAGVIFDPQDKIAGYYHVTEER